MYKKIQESVTTAKKVINVKACIEMLYFSWVSLLFCRMFNICSMEVFSNNLFWAIQYSMQGPKTNSLQKSTFAMSAYEVVNKIF